MTETQAKQELDTQTWRHALVPWKEGGRLYTYLVPPGIECDVGYQVMFETPAGGARTGTVEEMKPHEPTEFQCKPICNAYHPDDWRLMVEAAHPDKPTISMHEDYPSWKVEAADMFVEGR